MQKLIVIVDFLFAQNIFGQQDRDTQKIQHPLILKVKAVHKKSYGIYGSVCRTYNAGGYLFLYPQAMEVLVLIHLIQNPI